MYFIQGGYDKQWNILFLVLLIVIV